MTVTAATLDLTTAYYIVDTEDSYLTAEELALRPAAEALINAGPVVEENEYVKTVETSIGPMKMDRLWDLHYRGENGNISDDELNEYLAVVEYFEAEGAEKAAAEEARKARVAEMEGEEDEELIEKFGAESVAAVRDWYETHNVDGLADSYLDAMVDSGVMEDTLCPNELEAFEAWLAEGELSDVDEDDLHELAMERVSEHEDRFPVSYAMINSLTVEAEVANEIIHGF